MPVGNVDQGNNGSDNENEGACRKTVKLKLVLVRKMRSAEDRKRVCLLC